MLLAYAAMKRMSHHPISVLIACLCAPSAWSIQEVTADSLPKICPKLGVEQRELDTGALRIEISIPADEARFEVTREGEFVAYLAPQKRRYLASGSIMTEAAIDPGVFRDLFVAMGEPIGEQGAWAIRLHYKPFVRWIWAGAIAMALGAFMTLADRRYRRARRRAEAPAATETGLGTA